MEKNSARNGKPTLHTARVVRSDVNANYHDEELMDELRRIETEYVGLHSEEPTERCEWN